MEYITIYAKMYYEYVIPDTNTVNMLKRRNAFPRIKHLKSKIIWSPF